MKRGVWALATGRGENATRSVRYAPAAGPTSYRGEYTRQREREGERQGEGERERELCAAMVAATRSLINNEHVPATSS